MSPIEKSSKLDNVCYDIRGPVLKEAKRLEEEGSNMIFAILRDNKPFKIIAPQEHIKQYNSAKCDIAA